MSRRTGTAITYGVLSIFILGLALGLTIAQAPHFDLFWVVFVSIQIFFLAFAFGYNSGRSDEYNGRVKGNPDA